MKNSNLIGRIILAAACFAAISALSGMLIERKLSLSGLTGWHLLGSLMITVALSLTVLGARRGGWELTAAVFLLFFGVRNLNIFIEIQIFRIGVPDATAWYDVLHGLLTSLLFAPLLVAMLGRWRKAEEPPPLAGRSVGSWIWRIAAADFSYIFLYIVAGLIIFPFVKEFYANVPLPSPGLVFPTQILRGLVYVVAGLAVTRLMAGKPGRAALALAIAFPVLAGLEPLIYPNTIMPGNIRLPHAIEIGWSNAAYGALLGFMLTRRLARKKKAAIEPVESPQAA